MLLSKHQGYSVIKQPLVTNHVQVWQNSPCINVERTHVQHELRLAPVPSCSGTLSTATNFRLCLTCFFLLSMQVSMKSAMTVKSSRFVNNSIVGLAAVAFLDAFSVVTVSDTVVTNNTATNGGAFYVSSSVLHLNNCIMTENSARDGGGAVYSMQSDITATSTTFTRNSATIGGGWSSSNDHLTLRYCNFVANHARSGGALHMLSNCTANATSTSFDDNTAEMDGGAISSTKGCNTTLKDCIFSRNYVTAGGSGGALHLGEGNVVTATSTRFEGNNGTFGGAVSSNCRNIINMLVCHLVRNAATDRGGALHISDGSLGGCRANAIKSSLAASSCSFQNNTASGGGGAAYIGNGAGLNSSSSEFVLNSVEAGKGGAVLMGKDSSCQCNNTSFRKNQALQGGAVAVIQSALAIFSLGCEFISNDGIAGGGAVVVDGAQVVLENSTFQNNTSQQGGALLTHNVAEVTLGEGIGMVGNAAKMFGGAMLVDYECSQQVRLVFQAGARCQW
jgi:predicted outer membrane repeat protein